MSVILTIIVLGLAAFGALCLFVLWNIYLLTKDDQRLPPGSHP